MSTDVNFYSVDGLTVECWHDRDITGLDITVGPKDDRRRIRLVGSGPIADKFARAAAALNAIFAEPALSEVRGRDPAYRPDGAEPPILLCDSECAVGVETLGE